MRVSRGLRAYALPAILVSATFCYQHPDRPAVEQCEICRRPVCGSCLWYAESGERLCPDHAAEFERAGKMVTPPARYAAGIISSEISAAQPSKADAPYRGNSTDLSAFIAAVVGVAALTSCAGLFWALPLLAFALGLVAWLQAKDSLHPRRTRWLAGFGVVTSGVFVLAILLFFGLCFASLLVPVIVSSLSSGPGGPPIPPPFP